MKIPEAELKTAGWLIGILSILYFLPSARHVSTAR